MLIDILNTLRYTKEKGRFKSKDRLDKGEKLEREIFDILHTNLKGYKKVLVDLLIPNGRGGSTQIDLVLLHSTGIFVIECKNYNATVSGEIEDDNWVVRYKNNKEYTFYNPIKQNNGHIEKVMDVVGNYKKSVYKSFIVFSKNTVLDGCRLHKVIRGSKTFVTTEDKFKKNIVGLNEAKPIMSKKDIKKVYKQLRVYSKSSKRAKKKHSNYVDRIQKSKV